MNKSFYIFLDIDGVLNDWEFFKKEIASGAMKKGTIFEHFKPESINALNNLIKTLSKQFNVILVISSSWRRNLLKTETLLRKNGLKYDGVISATPITQTPEKRGLEILQFLKGKQNYDFVIIDDDSFDYAELFNSNKIIKTDVHLSALSMNMVDNYLKNILKLESQNNEIMISEK